MDPTPHARGGLCFPEGQRDPPALGDVDGPGSPLTPAAAPAAAALLQREPRLRGPCGNGSGVGCPAEGFL